MRRVLEQIEVEQMDADGRLEPVAVRSRLTLTDKCLGARSRVFHEDTEEREEILSQRHEDTKIEKSYMASYLSFLLRVFVSL